MSEAVQASSGYTIMLDALTSSLNAFAHLYVNDPDLDDTRVTADFVEANYPGYVPLPVTKWTPPALRGGLAFTVCDPLQFVFVGEAAPLPVRGYYVTDGPAGALLWAWRRPGDAWQFTVVARVLTIYVRLAYPLICA